MPLVIAVWPNNTISIVKMENGFSAVSLFDELDQICDPTDAKCYVVRPEDGRLCVNFDYDCVCDEKVGPKSSGLRLDRHQGRVARFHWPKTVWRDWIRVFAKSARVADREASAACLTAEELSQFPSAPSATFTVAQVRKMKPFSGVYFAFNEDGSCHYVGEAKDVTSRVCKSRPEIDDRMIGVIQCDPNERKRIECYFIGVLNPPGNSQSTHRMTLRQSCTKRGRNGQA